MGLEGAGGRKTMPLEVAGSFGIAGGVVTAGSRVMTSWSRLGLGLGCAVRLSPDRGAQPDISQAHP